VISRPTVLIVDAEQSTCDRLSQDLGEHGYDCCSATSVADALDRLKRASYDLALVDVNMPQASGMELLATMVQQYRNTAVVINTSVADTNTAVEAMKRGAVDYIMKPCSMDVVTARLGVALRRKSLPKTTTQTARDDSSPSGTAFRQLDSLARGVEAQVSCFDFHWKIVIEKTVEAARRLGFVERHINEWAAKKKGALLARERDMEWAVGNLGFGDQALALERIQLPDSETNAGQREE
jgi:FixJ family two-component response regulator